MCEGSAADVPVSGRVAPGFEAVRDAFAHLVGSEDETGAGLTVIHRGRAVVDLCGGWADVARTHAWTDDTVVNTFSVTKAFAALALLMLVDRGRAGLRRSGGRSLAGVRRRSEGRRDATVRSFVLAHQAGCFPLFPVAAHPSTISATGICLPQTSPPQSNRSGRRVRPARLEHALTYGHLRGSEPGTPYRLPFPLGYLPPRGGSPDPAMWMGFAALRVGLALRLPVATTVLGLVLFGVLHDVVELRYVVGRFGRSSPGRSCLLVALVTGVVVCACCRRPGLGRPSLLCYVLLASRACGRRDMLPMADGRRASSAPRSHR